MPSSQASRLASIAVLIVALFAATTGLAKKTEVRVYPPGSAAPAELGAGLPAGEYGYHPSDSKHWGESWQLGLAGEGGDYVWIIFSVSNYHPFEKFAGTLDLSVYRAGGEPAHGHAEFKQKQIDAALDRVQLDMGGQTIGGTYPDYRITAAAGDVAVDLAVRVTAPDFQLGRSTLQFGGDPERYWTKGVLAPKADVTGTITVRGEKRPFAGRGYFDHSRSTVKVPTFIRDWDVVNAMSADLAVGVSWMRFANQYTPDSTCVEHVADGDELIVNAGGATVVAEGAVTHKRSGITYADRLLVTYEDERVSVRGTIELTRLLEDVNILDRMSPFVRAVIKSLYTDPWQFRYVAKSEWTITRDGRTRTVSLPALAEVRRFR